MSGVRGSEPATDEGFTRFASDIEPRLRRALVAWYGCDVGCEVTAEAMAYAWERWDEVCEMANPVGYLFRVGQSRSRRYRRRPVTMPVVRQEDQPAIDPRLPGALAALSTKQRAAVLLVHAHDFTLVDAAAVVGCSVSTLRNHLARGMRKLRAQLGDDDDD
jgi:RNA polymerase sigma-70 factor (ECF subfamily)